MCSSLWHPCQKDPNVHDEFVPWLAAADSGIRVRVAPALELQSTDTSPQIRFMPRDEGRQTYGTLGLDPIGGQER